MLRWGFGKKSAPKSHEGGEAVDEWAALRQHPDYDADEMASVRRAAPPAPPQPLPAAPEPAHPAPARPEPARPEPARNAAPSSSPPTRERGRSGSPAYTHEERESAGPLGPAGELAVEISMGPLTVTQPILGELLIGRRDAARRSFPQVDVSGDDAVSRRHAEIRVTGGRYFLRDLNSLNGTFLNGRRLRPEREVPLWPGDRIEIGEATVIRVVDLHPAPEPVPPAETAPETDLTAEDRAISDLLRDALDGPAAEPQVDSAGLMPGRALPVDVLDLALEGGAADGLLSTQLNLDELER
ncbi:MAG TPA: FHA domain-containing protein [Armatimonadota bacterium]|nr:FHA domain-containing protein [Armatimonadota bacterium]